jgi:hypothetical protein
MPNDYIFPDYFGLNCPPKPHEDNSGVYYRVVKNANCADPLHFKSHYELGKMPRLEKTNPCGRRGVSMCGKKEHAQSILDALPEKGDYIATLDLNGGHGVVQGHTGIDASHYNWWIPNGIERNSFCKRIEGPFTR